MTTRYAAHSLRRLVEARYASGSATAQLHHVQGHDLRFPGAQAVPAVYAVGPDGSEALVPFDVRGDFLVVHETARQLRLRRGRAVLCIFNLAFDRYGDGAPSATAAPDVERTIRSEVKR